MTRDLSAWIEQHALSSPDRVAIRFDGVDISYRALHVQIERTAGFLHNTHGVGPGDRVAYLGRLEPYKNVDLLLRAMARLRERFPRTEIVVIGRGSAQRGLEALAQELGLADRTRFTGFVSDAERDRLLAETRVCVCPSAKEGWGLTVIESNAVATPVVATDAPGLRDSVREGETGFLVPEGDVEGFATRLAELLENDELATRMSTAALTWSREFDWNRSAREMAESLEAARSSG